ncbi:MAG: PRC-barrel domain-containing protein [Gammaproteobacteria bacterium]
MKLSSLVVYALTAPALTLGIGSAFATDPPAQPAGAKEQRATQEQRTTQEQRQMPEQAQKEKGMATADRAQEQRMAAERAKQHGKAQGTYLSSTPANSFRSDDLIGADLKSRSDDENIGPVTDLVIDENGKIAAVIVEVGGFLGLGKKEVAISWNSIERSLNEDRDGYDFSVDTTKDALSDAPEYKDSEYKTESKKY